MTTYWRQWRNWVFWWPKCEACGYRERRLVWVSAVIENSAPEPNSGSMCIDDWMCAGCATMFGWQP